MDYKVVYLEDLNPDSMLNKLRDAGFSPEYVEPKTFEETYRELCIKNADIYLFDFRLSTGEAVFDAPTIAQTLRTKESDNAQKFSPIILVSTEENISSYYKNYTSHDLFDFSISKDEFIQDIENVSTRMKDLVESYNLIEQVISDSDYLDKLLAIEESMKYFDVFIDSRIKDQLSEHYKNKDTFLICNYISNYIVEPTGILLTEHDISARLGISLNSKSWNAIKDSLASVKYKGILSNTFERWWSDGFLSWWKSNIDERVSPKRLSANERANKLAEHFEIDLDQDILKPSNYMRSSLFWNTCFNTKVALDPAEAPKLISSVSDKPWIDPKYLSIEEAISDLSILTAESKSRLKAMQDEGVK